MSDDNENSSKSFLGFDFSTQQVKAVIINEECEVLQEAHVHFDSELPEFRTHGGVIKGDDCVTVTSPTIMWVKGLDMVMNKLRVAGAVFSSVVAIAGCGQSHGSVYWQKGALQKLSNLQAEKFLFEQLMCGCFSLKDSPVWLDTSTTKYCKILEEAVGGKEVLAELTGSRAYERFTGSQIMKVFEEKPEIYANTERISLVSSFACSLFIGTYAPIDFSDGSGMNLLNISTHDWHDKCLENCGNDLRQKLGKPVSSLEIVGNISQYFVDRFEFNPSCKVVAFTGDNSASLASLRLKKGDVALSLGTSDTLFLSLDKPIAAMDGHIFVNPVDSNIFMGLLCFSNGSMAREHLRDTRCNGSWEEFDMALRSNPRGNFGNIGMYYFTQEILPSLKGTFCFPPVESKDKNTDELTETTFSKNFKSTETEIRALIEGQFLSRKVYALRRGMAKVSRIIATGGASANKEILQVASDIFNATVYKRTSVNSACLGSALMAKCSFEGGQCFDSSSGKCELVICCEPNKDAEEVYNPMLDRYSELLQYIVEKFSYTI